ncbi:MAG: sodium:alanine symporter family protein [Elusimicrobiota bacterium]|jgi:AGCS family alanine or glycine:cation symporter|nr:sodium:alanine symporter family protein [Elusimicrobiota bacterium]
MEWFDVFSRGFISFSGWLNSLLWGPWLLVLLFGTHLYMTYKTGFIQRKIFLGIKMSLEKDDKSKGDVSHFGALTTALAATIGTGNIVGVGTAIALGGPGAVLWMWLTGVFGIATKYAESLIAVKYRVRTADGQMLGGAMYALERLSINIGVADKSNTLGDEPVERKMSLKWLGVLFAIFAAICAFGIGSGVQANAVAANLQSTIHLDLWISGFVIAILVGLVILGGIQIISKVCIGFIPAMAILYCLGCGIILIMNFDYIFPAVSLIVSSAFSPRAAGGGFIAATFMAAARFGIARGLFSNESGMGSAPIVAAAAKTRNPFRQALVSSTGTFWDTVIICAITGVTLVSTIVGNPTLIPDPSKINGGLLTNLAFGQIPIFGNIVLTFGLVTFAFSTILGWSYYGERCAEYLLGAKVRIPYRILFVIVTFIGATIPLGLVWEIADSLNALMAIPNIIAVLLLSNLIAKETKYYLTGDNMDKFDDTPIPLYGEEIR